MRAMIFRRNANLGGATDTPRWAVHATEVSIVVGGLWEVLLVMWHGDQWHECFMLHMEPCAEMLKQMWLMDMFRTCLLYTSPSPRDA